MSAENVEAVRRLLEAFNRRDLEAMFADLDPECEIHPLRAQLEGKAYRGLGDVRRMFEDFEEDWESLELAADEYRDAGEEVVVLGRLRARGRTSHVDLEVPIGFVWRFRRGKAVYGRSFSESADALREAGLD